MDFSKTTGASVIEGPIQRRLRNARWVVGLFGLVRVCLSLIHILKGRFTVSWEDVAALAGPVLRHRLILSFRGEADGVKTDDLVRRMIDEVG